MFNYDDESYESIYSFEEEVELSIEAEIEELRGNVTRGSCLYCHEPNGMIYEGNICFVCTKCNQSVHEDLYYRWLVGGDIQNDEY